jgi:hypothetical protein
MLLHVGFHPIVVYLFNRFSDSIVTTKMMRKADVILKIFPHSFQFQVYPFFPFFVEVKTIFIDWFSMVYDLQITGRFSSKNKEGKTLFWCSFSRHNKAKTFLESHFNIRTCNNDFTKCFAVFFFIDLTKCFSEYLRIYKFLPPNNA